MATFHASGPSTRQLGLTREQARRSTTWIAEIARDLRPGVPHRIYDDGELRIGNKGSLSINPDGRWCDFEAGEGGFGAVALIAHLMDTSPADATQYASTWLAAHPGDGAFAANPATDADQAEKARRLAYYAREALARSEPVVPGGTTHRYLERRRLLGGPLPDCVRHLAIGRQNESAIVGILTDADGAVVGVQLGHLLADGGKSPYTPGRNQYLINAETFGAFNIPVTAWSDGRGVPEIFGTLGDTLLVCEGLENAVATHRAFPTSRVMGLPGIGRLAHLTAARGQKILVIGDGDAEDSPARKALLKGIDALILQGAAVTLAMSPPGGDSNSLLIQGGVDAIHDVVATARPAPLSVRGHYHRAARMPDDAYEVDRKAWAKAAGVRVSVLDRERKRLREAEAPKTDTSGLMLGDDTAWPTPVDDIQAVCDAALVEVQRYIVADPDDLAVLTLWSLGGHFVHHDTIHLTRYPRLEIGGEDIEVGKTTSLEITGALLPRSLPIGGSITAAAYYRLVDAHKASVLIDEAHDLFKSKDGSQSHLLRILRSGHTRKMAYVLLTEPAPDGKHVLKQFSTWTSIAYTVVGRLADAGTRSRAISIRLVRALEGEVTADFDEGDSPVLDTVRQKFTRWAADQTELPMVPRPPGLFNRRWNNWAPLLRIAALIGGDWPDRVMRAAQRALTAPAPTNSDGAVAALTDIRIVFDTPVRGTLRTEIESQQLCNEMAALAEPSAEWARLHRGQAITPHYLRERLRGLLSPPGSRRVMVGSRKLRGYHRFQFEDAFRRYLPPTTPDEDDDDVVVDTAAAASGPSGPGPNSVNDISETARTTCETTCNPAHVVQHVVLRNPLNVRDQTDDGPDGPHGPLPTPNILPDGAPPPVDRDPAPLPAANDAAPGQDELW